MIEVPCDFWKLPPTDIFLPDGEVHVWLVFLDTEPSRVRLLQTLLSADELQRAGRFYFYKHFRHFVVGRGLLRVILGRYLDIDPSKLSFNYSDHGKPMLTSKCNRYGLRFNLAHANELAVYAVTRGREVGVDIECAVDGIDFDSIAERFFSIQEARTLENLPAKLKKSAFYNCWTRKEAYLKGRGDGLSIPLHKVEVTLAPGNPARLVQTVESPRDIFRWSLLELNLGPDYIGTIAVEGRSPRLRCWRCQE